MLLYSGSILTNKKTMVQKKILKEKVREAYKQKKRLAAPLVGFPGLQITGSSIKLAQQNYIEHVKVINEIVKRFQPDAVFPLMDLAVEANAIGLNTQFPKDDSATVIPEELSIDQLEKLSDLDINADARVVCYVETIKRMADNLPQSILKGSYVAGPYTLAALILGAENAAMATITNPEKLNAVCEFSRNIILQYVKSLINAGAQLICVLEPSAAMLGPDEFSKFSANHVSNIVDYCNANETDTIYHICGNTTHIVEIMKNTGVDALSLDSKEAGVNLKEIAEITNDEVVLIGNLNPTGKILSGTPDEVRVETSELLIEMNNYENFILSTGCDLPQEVPLENIDAFVTTGRKYRIE